MAKGWIAGTVDGRGFVYEQYYLPLVEKAKLMGERWFVLPASKIYDSTLPKERGGYSACFLEEMAGGREVKQYSIQWQQMGKDDKAECWLGGLKRMDYNINPFDNKIPINEKGQHPKVEVRRWIVKQIIKNHPYIEDAWEDQGNVKCILIKRTLDEEEWGFFTRKNLFSTCGSGGKATKRRTQWYRKFLGSCKVNKDDIKIIVIEGDEKALDGGFIISRDLADLMLQEMKEKANEMITLPGGTRAPIIPIEVLAKFAKTKVFNGRVWTPGGIIEDERGNKIDEFREGCQIKGDAYVNEDLPGLTILTHRTNIKEEIHVFGDYVRIGVVPHTGKDKARTNTAYIINNRWLMDDKKVLEWVKKTYEKLKIKIVEGKVENDLDFVIEQMNRTNVDMGEHYSSMDMKVAYWVNKGLPLHKFPKWGLLEYLKMKGNHVVNTDDGDIHARIPYCVRYSIISNSMMRLIDEEWKNTAGGMIQWPEDVFVVNDKDYKEVVQVNHGGSDQDDSYEIMFRKFKEVVWCFVLRSPNGWGEWSAFKFFGVIPEGWNVPELESKYQPSVPINMRPEHKSLMTKGGKCSWHKEAGYEEFDYAISNSSGGAGQAINIMDAYSLMRYTQAGTLINDELIPVTKEEVVDNVTQGVNVKNISIIEEEMKKVMITIHQCDHVFNQTRNIHLPEYDGWFTRLIEDAGEEKKKYNLFVDKWTEDNFTPPDEPMLTNKQHFHLAYNTLQNLLYKFTEVEKDAQGKVTEEGWVQLKELRRKVMENYWKPWMIPYVVYMIYYMEGSKFTEKLLLDQGIFEAYADWMAKQLPQKKREEEDLFVCDGEYAYEMTE